MMSLIHSTTEQSTMLPCNPLFLADQQPKKKSVAFSGNVRMKKHMHINNYTPEEIEACWFTKAELSQSSEEISYTIELMTRGEGADIDASKYCTRGLECRTPLGAATKNKNKIAAWDSVMDEQDKQFNMGINDVDTISMVYIQCTMSCQVSATIMAALDARCISCPSFSSCSSPASPRKRQISGRNFHTERRFSVRC
jgi:hypothetical protein